MIEPKLDVIEPLSNAPVVTIVAPPLIGAYEAFAVAVSSLASICGCIALVTPWTLSSSAAVVSIPDNLLISEAVAVTSVAPNFKLVAVTFPETVVSLLIVNELFPNNNKLVLLTCPIVELLITTLSTSKLPATILPSVLIVLEPGNMSPKLVVIEPLSRAPTVTVLELPDDVINAASASALVYLLFNCVCMALVTPWTWSNSAAVVSIPVNLLSSAADDVTATLLSLILFADITPLTLVSLPIANESTPSDNKPGLEACPIVELFITTLSTSRAPACIVPDVVILLAPVLMEPKLLVIEPPSRAPTVTIELAPLIGA